MAEIAGLLDVFRAAEKDRKDLPNALAQRLRSDAARPGLNRLLSVLRAGVSLDGAGRRGFEGWTPAQIDAVASVVGLVFPAVLSVSAELSELALVGFVAESLEFCISFLEKSRFDGENFSLQDKFARLLESALADRVVEEQIALYTDSLRSYSEQISTLPVNTEILDLSNYLVCNQQGFNCMKNSQVVERLLTTLSSECGQMEPFHATFSSSTDPQTSDSMASAAQHLAVIHLKCYPRLLTVCKKLLHGPLSFDKLIDDQNLSHRLSFTQRILKLLLNLARKIPLDVYDPNLLHSVASFVDTFPTLFKLKFDFSNYGLSSKEVKYDSVLLEMLEDFLELIQVSFYGSNIFYNVQACMLASMMEILDSKVWRYDTSSSSVNPPIIYSPQIILYMLKILKDSRSWVSDTYCVEVKPLPTLSDQSCQSETGSPSCHIHSENISLLKKYTFEEHLTLICPQSAQWVGNLVHLAYFLHSEGVKMGVMVETSRASCVKPVAVPDFECVANHDDEAIFGNLFSEGSRSIGSVDGLDQPISAVIGSSCNSDLSIQVAADVLIFLKACIFSPEWSHLLFVDACRQINENIINQLLAILNCQTSLSFQKNSESGAVLNQHPILPCINDICFQLLQNLLVNHVFSHSLKEHIIDQVLKLEDGAFTYNDYSLSLLAHTLILREDVEGSPLTMKLYEGYVCFLLEKVKEILCESPESRDFYTSLPSSFHLEILLMAFHLSKDAEKDSLAKLVFSSLTKIDSPPPGSSTNQLFWWGLYVSRFLLILRHFILYSSNCPSWFLLLFRSHLRKIPSKPFQSQLLSHLPSWASKVVENLFSNSNRNPSADSLLVHLIDVGSPLSPLSKDDISFQRIDIDRGELASTCSWILNFWSGRKAEAVEHLILERYIYSLCWSIISANGYGSCPTSPGYDWLNPDLLDFRSFYNFSFTLIRKGPDICTNVGFPEVIGKLLELQDGFPSDGWDFLRRATWLSLIFSLLNAGLSRCSMRNTTPGTEGEKSSISELVFLGESMILDMFESKRGGWLLGQLSSILKMHLQVFHRAFTQVASSSQSSADAFTPLLLLKHTRFDKSKWEVLLEKSGCNISRLESLYNILPKLDLVAVQDTESTDGIIMRSLLHGFPSTSYHCDGILLSCILTIKDIISILEGYFRIKDRASTEEIEAEVKCQLLESMMMIKYDRIFEIIHEKCDYVCNSLIGQKELGEYNELFHLKQLEVFLAAANDTSDSDSKELLIDMVVDLIQGLQRENSQIFKVYLGFGEAERQEPKELFDMLQGNFLVLIDALDNCHSEAVNLKVLKLFVDLFSSPLSSNLKEKIQKKFLQMDLLCLSHWLEKRLLGDVMEFATGNSATKSSSTALRELTVNFVGHLVSQPSEILSSELHGGLIEAMLMSFDRAFIFCDIQTVKAYFSFVVQLLNGDPSMKQLFEKSVMLIDKLVDSEALLHGLKFLLGFIGTVLSNFGANKKNADKISSKLDSSNSSGPGGVAIKPVNSRRNSENLVLPTNRESASASLDCDATSVDDDEDDGTSDGELGSIDKDEDEDSTSERALASKVCTFTSSGNNFMEQHWYFCYTCDLTVSKGCCSVCAKVCHRGHRVVYSRSSRFFCDCGAGGVRGSSCQCLKPRKFTGGSNITGHGSGNFQSFLPISTESDQAADSDSDFDDDLGIEMDNFFKLTIPKKLEDDLPAMLVNLDIEGRLLSLCNKLLPAVIRRRDSSHSTDNKVVLGKDKMLSYGVDLFQLKKVYKSGTLDLKIKADYPNSKELKPLLACGSLTRSLLSISSRGRLAAGEGDKVAIFDVGQLIGQPTVTPVTADKTNFKPLSKNIVRFEIVHLIFNPMVDNYLAVAGFEDCQVLTVNPRGEVTDRLAVELALQGAYIRRVVWVPGSQVQLMVVSNMFVKIYDLSQDNISPLHYFTLSDDLIMDATLVPASMGKAFLLVLSENGCLFRLNVSIEGDVGAKVLTDTISIQKNEVQSKGLSLCYSCAHRLLFLSYQDGITLLGRLDAGVTTLMEQSYVYENEQDGNVRPAGLHHWKDLFPGSGLFFGLSSLRSNAALSISLSANDIFAQNMRYGASLSLPVVGVAAYKPLSKDKTHCLVLQDDGSLQIYSHIHTGVDTAPNLNADQMKKLGSSILNNRAYAGVNPEFPLEFFERTMCITGDAKFSSDAVKNGDSEGIKQRLTSEDGFLEGPSAGFKVTVSNTNPEMVMVGCRIHVGNTSASHIPSQVAIFQRVVKLDEGMRSWYDIPFTVAESLLADEEITIAIGRTFDASSTPRIDSLEIYGRAKDEFGWKEKMEAVLDMGAHFLGKNSGVGVSGKKYRSLHAAPVQEQVLADSVKLLSRIYSSCRPQYFTELESPDINLNRLKCRTLLETIFQSDGEPLLHSAACHVLQSIFLKRETYYRVKDTMRLLGAVKSFPMLLSRIGVGGAAAGWVIKEFTSQMQAVSKIAFNRRQNVATFLELYGSEVVDGLMQVLWGILDLEQPETQMINSIVIPSVELLYSYAECLALHGTEPRSVAPAVALLKKLLFAPYEAVQTASSLAISSRLLQVPFPKQTMLATDDVSENSATTPGSSSVNATNGNVPGMIEEDSTTSSVQYCCDGCSTVPILRRRWHCNICPDFDLCEACYEVLDADRLPPPHSRDHLMSAIPIEIDSLGAESNEIHFSIDELSGSSLMQVSAEIGMQNSQSSIHVLESNESGDFSAPMMDQTVVSISASQRALNSLLLRHLIGELKGWMDTTSGFRAIPVMQLFYRLSSAVGGPFMDSSIPDNLDLESFVQWLLEEINLNRPFPAKARSSFGEVAIVVFMFFTLMLRNWHHPGGEVSQSKPAGSSDLQDRAAVKVPSLASSNPSSNDDLGKNEFAAQLVRACSFLRQQTFLNYLMDILLQLVSTFKSSVGDADSSSSSSSGCGSLLTVRRELPVGNFSPFFSDSYAKSHRTDLFSEYHKLLLENTFRLVYALVRPEKQDKSAEKEKTYNNVVNKDLKLDGFQDVLCSYISNPHTTFIRRHARRLLLHLCGSKTQYYNIRDSWQFSNEVKRLNKLVNKSGGFESPVPYERSVKLVKCLSAMSEVAAARPRNWQKFCLKHIDLLQFLMDGIIYFGEESVMQTLKLLNLAFYTGKDTAHSSQKVEGDAGATSTRSGTQSSDSKKKRRSEDGTETSSDKSFLDMEQAVEVFMKRDSSVLGNIIDSFLLEWNSSSVRQEAKFVLYGIWYHGKQPFKEALLTALLEKVKYLPAHGQNILECTELMMWLLGEMPDGSIKQQEAELIGRCLTPSVISSIFETLHLQNELLANHPNSHIYNTLSGLVEFDGYYLESEPCVSCSCPEVPYSRMKLESLKSETKFTDNRIIVKCTGSYTIQSISMNVHDARKSKSVKVLNLYYNNRPVADLSELKNNWSLWKRAKSCHLSFNQTELKVEFIIPITACNFMIELDSFYENLQASSMESLQCPRCSRSVTDKHGICSNCHENAYQCRQCRNINYENLDSFLCNECGYSKYGRFEFNFMAKPSFSFDNMENDEDMKKGLAAIESESENAHRRYQQLLGFKKPLLKLVSSVGENEIDPQQKDSVQQMMVSLPGPSCKINRKVALLGVLYGEKCKAAFDSVSKSIQTLQGLRRVLMTYLQQKNTDAAVIVNAAVPRSSKNCYGCAITFVTRCLELLQVLSKHATCKKQLVTAGILTELFENNIHQGPKTARIQARAVVCAFSEGDSEAVSELNNLIQKKVIYCLEHHRSMDIALATREELLLLSDTCTLVDEHWEARLRVAFQLFFSSIKLGAKHPAISEHIILPCLRIISQACTPPRSDVVDKEQISGKSPHSLPKNEHGAKQSSTTNNMPNVSKVPSELVEKHWDSTRKGQDIPLLSYSEWERGATYLDFVRRQCKVSQAVRGFSPRIRQDSQKNDYLALKYALRWKRCACKRTTKNDLSKFSLGSWVSELILSTCSQSIRSEVSSLVILLCPQSSFRRFQLLNLLMSLLPASLLVGESAAEYFDLFFQMIESEAARLYLTVKGCLTTICKLIRQEVSNVESQEKSLNIDISQGFILHKLIELLSKFLEVPNIRFRFMQDELLSEVLEALLVVQGIIVQKTKLINDCNRLLKELLDGLLLESTGNKRQFIRACISGLQNHGKARKGRTSLFILEQICNMICPTKPEPVYLLILNKVHTQEEFIRGSMTKNPYSSTEIGPLMRDVKNKICHQLDLLGLLEDDYGMELLVSGNIISLDLSISQVYEQVWRKYHNQNHNSLPSNTVFTGLASSRDCPPMTVTYRLQGLDGEATEPMINDLEEEREESQDPEVEFAIAGAVRECGGLEIILSMIQRFRDDEFKSNQEELASTLNLLMYCCKIRENRQALLQLGALGLLLETARRAFSVDAMEPAEGILLIVESLTMEANESNIGINQSVFTVTNEESGAGEQAKKIVLMFLERLCHPLGSKKSSKQQRNNEMVARILPYLTYGEPAAMEALIQHFYPYLQDWGEFDRLQKQHEMNQKEEGLAQEAARQRYAIENFVRVSESLKTSSCGERLKDIILEKGITAIAVKHLRGSFAVTGQTGFKSSMEWASGLKLPSLPLILSMLRGLSKGHMPTQRCIDEEGILPLLHALEGVSGENEIGAKAENFLDTLADKESNGDGFLGDKINKLRHATRDEMRRRALRKREELLQRLGMRQEFAIDGGERIVVAQPVIEGLEDVEEEEDGLACMVCREGYTLRPNDMLGVYSYSKRVNLGTTSSSSGRGDCVYTTVSHFNIIHFQCHQEAKRADAALKNPKKEWEGATLRNNETLCNCIFPLRGPSVPIAQYTRCVDQYWDNLNSLGRADGSRLRLLTCDIVLMLARFATGASFSVDCKGGGKESNSRFLPFMIQMASFLLDQGSTNHQRRGMAKSVAAYLSNSDSISRSPSSFGGSRSSSGPSDETVQFMMVNSLLSESYEDWLQHRPSFLQRGIHHAYLQHKHGRSTLRFSDSAAALVQSNEGSSTDLSDDSKKLFAIVQPMLVYTGLIEQLQRFFKVNKAVSPGTSKESGVDGASGLEGWEIVTKERMVNIKEIVGFSKDLLPWLEEMNSAEGFQEAFDTMGALPDALSGGASSCEDFVRAAIQTGKS